MLWHPFIKQHKYAQFFEYEPFDLSRPPFIRNRDYNYVRAKRPPWQDEKHDTEGPGYYISPDRKAEMYTPLWQERDRQLKYEASVQHSVCEPAYDADWWMTKREKAVVTGRARVCVTMAYEETKCFFDGDGGKSEEWEICGEVVYGD